MRINGTRMTRIVRISADLIRFDPLNPRHPRAILNLIKQDLQTK
jgi:hypothetical protein